MNIINLSVPAGVSSPVAECGAVMIGYVGESGVTQVTLDFSAWAEAYGDGVITLGVQRSGDASWYPVALSVDGTTAAWLVSRTDTNVEGMGVARFAYTVGGAEKRSAVWQFFVDRGLQSPEGDAPDPYESWVETLTELGTETLENAQDAQEAAEAAQEAKTAAEDAQGAAETAQEASEAAASTAGESARAAGESASTAQGAAQTAQSAAGAAAESKTAAEASASAAAQAATNAEDSADQAEMSAGSASDSAADAATSMSSAAQSAAAAGAAASTAGDAAIAAQAAQAAAETARAGAETAENAAGQSAADAALSKQAAAASESNAEVSERLAGAAAAAAETSAHNAGLSETAAHDYAVDAEGSASDAAESAASAASAASTAIQQINAAGEAQVQAVEDKGEEVLASIPPDYSSLVSDVEAIDETKLNKPASIGSAGQVLGLDNQLTPVWIDQSGGGDVSNCAPIIINTASGDIATFADGADNRQIRKIIGTIVTPEGGSGWTGANIYSGQNLIDSLSYFIGKSGITIDGDNTNGYTLTGLASALRAVEIPIPDTLVGKTIQIAATMSPKTNGSINWTVTGLGSTIFLNTTRVTTGDVKRVKGTVTVTKSGGKFKLDYSQGDKEASVSDIMITGVGSGDYAPYSAIVSLPINWQDTAGTIYRGTVTLNEDGSADVVNNDSGNSYHLTGIGQLYTYIGTNNVWIDTGAITECDYPADTKLYVDGLTAPDEDMIADGLITSGKYFTVNNQLYISTAQIAAGAQIIPGSNCTATSIAEALNALNT